MHRRLWFWLVLGVVVVVGWHVLFFIQVLHSTDGEDYSGFSVWRHDGPGPNGTYELTEAEMASLAPGFAQAFAQAANSTGEAKVRVSAQDAEKFRETVHETEHYHDALKQRYNPAGHYVRYKGVVYGYSFTVT